MFSERKITNIAKITISGYLFLLTLLTGSCSSSEEPNPNAKLPSNTNNSNTKKVDQQISLFDGRFSFVLPDGFKLLPVAEIKREMADNAPRNNIFSNANQTAYIKIDFGEVPLEPDQLPEVKNFVERLHKNYSSWINSEIIDLNGRQWFYFEWEKLPVPNTLVAPVPFEEDDENSNVNKKNKAEVEDEKPVYYREYTTSLSNQKLSIVFEVDSGEYPQLKEAFNKSIQTIQIKDNK